MQDWTIHWLEAEGSLRKWRGAIVEKIDAASTAVSKLVPSSKLDILVQRGRRVIPEIGMVGYAHRQSLFSLVVDPKNPNFSDSMADNTLTRTVIHEVHHCLRMAGPGYGSTLGEALVSEGLAGQFVRELVGNPPEPWEEAVEEEDLKQHLPNDDQLGSEDYHHNSWFFGTGGQRPRWLGYTLGYKLVGAWLCKCRPIDAETWTAVPAKAVLSVGMRELQNQLKSP